MEDHFYKAYDEMLENIQAIEESGMADIVEVYTRSENPSRPLKIYSSRNREFKDARTAVIVGRERDIMKKNLVKEEQTQQSFQKRVNF